MKPFKDYLKFPMRVVEHLGYDQHDTSGDDRGLETHKTSINDKLRALCSEKFFTPHIAMERIAKLFTSYGVILNKHNTLEGDHGVTAFQISQFGNKSGMTNDGKAVTVTDEPFMLYFEWFGCGGYFSVTCKLVTREELDTLLESTDKDDKKKKYVWDRKWKPNKIKAAKGVGKKKKETIKKNDEVHLKHDKGRYGRVVFVGDGVSEIRWHNDKKRSYFYPHSQIKKKGPGPQDTVFEDADKTLVKE